MTNVMYTNSCVLIGMDGEDSGPTVVTLDDIAHNIEQSHYSGIDMWTRYMAVVRAYDGEVVMLPVVLKPIDQETQDNDICITTWRVVINGEYWGTFYTKCDMRA